VIVVEDPEDLLAGRRLGHVREVAQHRVHFLPAGVAHGGAQRAQVGDCGVGEEVVNRVGVEHGVEDRHLGAQRLEHGDRAGADVRHLRVHRRVAERRRVGDPDGHVGVVERGHPGRLGAGE